MSPRPAVVASDAHLGAAPSDAERRFLSFLEAVPSLTDDLVLVGDVFDFWFGYERVVIRRYFPALRRLARLREAGVRVRFVGGNHDAWTSGFLRDDLGIEIVEGPAVVRIAGRRTYLAHGDGLAGGDWGYRALKLVTRSRPARRLFRLLPPDLSLPAVERLSRTGEAGSAPDERARQRSRVLSSHADRLLEEDPSLDLVVFGHAHVPELREVHPGRHYLNPGDWIHHFTYGVVSADTVALRGWEETAAG